MSIWAPGSLTPVPRRTEPSFPRRVKDWPAEAQKEFKQLKQQLIKHAKKHWKNQDNLALIAYEALYNEYTGEWERRIEERKNVIEVEDPWAEILKLKG